MSVLVLRFELLEHSPILPSLTARKCLHESPDMTMNRTVCPNALIRTLA